MLSCPHCSHMNPAGATFCNKCGLPLSKVAPTGFIPIGSLINQRYRIISPLGGGGMGFVYKATDIQLNRTVAVKEMRQSGLSPQEVILAADLFRQESQLLASLRHTSLPAIHDRFTENGRWYLVMDFIEGEDLETHLQKFPSKKLPVRDVLRIGEQICAVLEYLHSQRPPIIFRDLKPANIMITSQQHIFLIDFGIARLFSPGKAQDTQRAGSPGYAPPEQYGLAQTDARADVYSLGATLHQLLTGRHPAAQPFNFPPIRSSCPDAPASLERLIQRMTDLTPGNRPVSATAVKQELAAITLELNAPPAAPAQPAQAVPVPPAPAPIAVPPVALPPEKSPIVKRVVIGSLITAATIAVCIAACIAIGVWQDGQLVGNYSATIPGNGCDHGDGMWTTQQNASIKCQQASMQLTQGSKPTLAEETFDGAGSQSFAADNSVAVTISEPDNECAGILMRGQYNSYGTYSAFVCGNGSWYINVYNAKDGSPSTLNSGTTTQHSVATNQDTYEIKTVAQGATESLTVNGVQVSSVQDNTYSQTSYVALTEDTQGGSALFSDFVYTSLS